MSIFLCEISSDPWPPGKKFLQEKIQFDGVAFCYEAPCRLVQYGENRDYFGVLFGTIYNINLLIASASNDFRIPLDCQESSDLQKLFVLKAYYGDQLSTLLRGDFTLILIHVASLKVELIKSPFSFKDIYYAYDDRTFYCSNSLPALRQNLPSHSAIDPEKLIDFFSRDYRLFDRSFYQGILQLGSAELVQWQPYRSLIKKNFWVAEDRTSSGLSIETYIFGLKEHFETAVGYRLGNDRRACAFISGGLDSTSIAGVLAQQVEYLTGCSDFTSLARSSCGLATPEKRTNERFLRDFEMMYPNTKILRHDGQSFCANYSEITRFCFDHVGGPEHAPGNLIWFLPFFKLAQEQEFNKIFGGGMGDAAFSFRVELVPLNLRRIIKNFLLLTGMIKQPQGKSSGFDFLLPIREEIKRNFPGNRIGTAWANQDLSIRRVQFLNVQNEYMTAASRFSSGALNQFGVEYVDPTCDLSLIEYCLTIPVEAYQKNKTNRYVTREAMKGVIPESVRLNQIKGAQGSHWHHPLRRELGYYKDLVQKFNKNYLIAEIVDLPKLKKLLLEFEHLPVQKLTTEHQIGLVNTLHIGEWVLLHDE